VYAEALAIATDIVHHAEETRRIPSHDGKVPGLMISAGVGPRAAKRDYERDPKGIPPPRVGARAWQGRRRDSGARVVRRRYDLRTATHGAVCPNRARCSNNSENVAQKSGRVFRPVAGSRRWRPSRAALSRAATILATWNAVTAVLTVALGSPGAEERVVSLTFASWNQLDGWLRQIERLRRAA
jgi:hypothetical protein